MLLARHSSAQPVSAATFKTGGHSGNGNGSIKTNLSLFFFLIIGVIGLYLD